MNRALRKLYLCRTAIAAIWVAPKTSAASSDRPDAATSLLTGLLLVIYPLPDVIATLIDLRANGQGLAERPQRVNAVAGAAATVAAAATVRIRASPINGCAYYIDVHTKDARATGESEQRMYASWPSARLHSGNDLRLRASRRSHDRASA